MCIRDSSPSYRFYLAPTFSIPISVLAIIFYALMLVNVNLYKPSLFMLGGGALTGFVYMMLLKNGKQPGMWIYNMFDKLSNMAAVSYTHLDVYKRQHSI